MIAYHWSPRDRRESILRHGLLVPTRHPRLVTPTVCSEGHRNPYISLARDPHTAWWLSGGFLLLRDCDPPRTWDLWQADLPGRKCRPNVGGSSELVARADISRQHLTLLASRDIENP
ncbi:hypothetical protein B5566_02355 [Mycobacterium sp. MHSD3]|nr:hypothetical protein B5566_02355 [Mycobacterium sp. MHSD3]